MPHVNTVAELLGANGPFIDLVDGFDPRETQQSLATAIEQRLADHGALIAESGTGTGKTFAYLVPALLSGKKVLISTGTKNLQDQLYNRDLPLVRKALEIPVSQALLKGRANYLCLHRFEGTQLESRFHHTETKSHGKSKPGTGRQETEIEKLVSWAGITKTGDINEIEDIAENSEIWPAVTSTSENCLGSQCGHYQKCFINRARRQALDSEIVIVNHHLFFADLVLKEEGFGALLPGADAVIFDEAHQLPEIATNFFGITLSGRQLTLLCRDTVVEDLKEKSGVKELKTIIPRLEKAIVDFRLALGKKPRRDAWLTVESNKTFQHSLSEMIDALKVLDAALEIAAGTGQGLASCYRRANELLNNLLTIAEEQNVDYINWFETSQRTFTLHMTPLDIAGSFRQYIDLEEKSWVFTSATLSVRQSFKHYQSQLGLEEAVTGCWESPFDYRRQALFYIPKDMPRPADPGYTEEVIEQALPVLRASEGRAFMLFTSHRALNIAAELLPGRVDYPVLVQGEAPRPALLDQFREHGNAILLGTGSFWGGVDVRGSALSCVIIDKLPFAAPDDPVLRARGAAMEANGHNPFIEYQLPQAVITLKQGAGRLIRDNHDHGVLVICDPRLLSMNYGRLFRESLPPMPLTQELEDVEAFFRSSSCVC